ncbi:MAG: 2,3-bisphosphoglycerate-independent phosphoglycerate mutase [Thermoplasmata archaeon]|nr:2,3-bisphosphoglycerate-independent phosphoglycerate mutase [Thermoplasmata archaeon]
MADLGKMLIVICDGLGDRPAKELKGKTPLQVAKKPTMNKIAREGICGMMYPIDVGVRAGSDTSHLAILGYDPYKLYTGRGPYEAAGVGLEVRGGDVALRCNFSTVDDNLVVEDRRAGRIKERTDEIAKALDGMEIEGVKVLFKESVEHRAVLVLRGDGLSPYITDADPHGEGRKVSEVKALKPEAELTARVVNQFVKESYRILKEHPVNRDRVSAGLPPANIVLPRGAGIVPHIPKVGDLYHIKGAAITGIALVKGVCRVAGLDIIEVKGATGGLDTNMMAKAEAVVKALDNYDLVFLNIKAPDICGHDGNAGEKVKVIERIDAALAHILNNANQNYVMALTADHTTPVSVKDHTGDAVPLSIRGEGVRKDAVRTFDEIACARGGLGTILGKNLLPLLLQLTARSEKFGS